MLQQHWVHSHEEDTEDELVYRLAQYNFPPARGRKGFELCKDGTLVEYAVGAADRPISNPGQWKLVGDQVLMYTKTAETPSRMMTIIALEPEKLILRKGLK